MEGGNLKADGANGKDNQEEFELARANFEKTSAVLEKLIKSISKVYDSIKVSMWAVIDLSEVMKEFLGAGPSSELEGSMNEHMKEIADQLSSMNKFYDQHKAFRTKIERRESLSKTASSANGVKTRAALEELDKQLKDELVSHHYSRYRHVAPDLHKYVQTQMKFFNLVNETLSGMSEYLAKKCRGEEDLDWTLGRNSLKKSSRRDKSMGGSSGAVPIAAGSLSSSRSATSHTPPAPSSPVPPPRVRPGTLSARDPPPVPPKNRSATTASRSHIGGKVSGSAPSSLTKIYRRSVSQQNLVNKKLSELGDEVDDDKEERSHSVDDGKELGDLRSMLVDSGVSVSLTSSEKKVTIPAPSYPRPQGVAPPPSRPVSTQVTKEEVEAERQRDPTKFRRQPPTPGGPRGPTSGPFGLPASPSLSSSLISSVAIPSLSSPSSTQSEEHNGNGSPPGSPSASPPPIPSPLNKPKNTLTRALSAAEDPDWALQPRKAKGTTGVQPTVVAERRQYWKSLDGKPTI